MRRGALWWGELGREVTAAARRRLFTGGGGHCRHVWTLVGVPAYKTPGCVASRESQAGRGDDPGPRSFFRRHGVASASMVSPYGADQAEAGTGHPPLTFFAGGRMGSLNDMLNRILTVNDRLADEPVEEDDDDLD